MIRVWALFFWIALILAGSAAVIIFAAGQLNSDDILDPEIMLPLIVIVGVIALLAALAITTAAFGLFGLTSPKDALGLPPGSVQAVIALSLIMIFAVVALYASSTAGTEEFESKGVSPSQLEEIPADELVSSTPENGGKTFTVVRSIDDPERNAVNTQLLTTVSTLVVAVAGFFFGSKSVQDGNKALKEGIEATGVGLRSLALVEPSSPYTWGEGESSLVIKVRSVPADAKLQSSVLNDDEFQLGEVSAGTFVYRPGEEVRKPGSVTLEFAQVDDPGVSATLVVNFPEEGGEPAEPEPTGKPEEPKSRREPEKPEPGRQPEKQQQKKPDSTERQHNLAASKRQKLRQLLAKRGFPRIRFSAKPGASSAHPPA